MPNQDRKLPSRGSLERNSGIEAGVWARFSAYPHPETGKAAHSTALRDRSHRPHRGCQHQKLQHGCSRNRRFGEGSITPLSESRGLIAKFYAKEEQPPGESKSELTVGHARRNATTHDRAADAPNDEFKEQRPAVCAAENVDPAADQSYCETEDQIGAHDLSCRQRGETE